MVKPRLPHLTAVAIFLLMVLSLVTSPARVQAQTPEPTPQPTPANQYGVTLSSGAEVVVIRSVTYGDIAVVVAVVGLSLLILFYILLRSTRLWTAR